MTRLFAPLGEGQHPISPRAPDPFPASAIVPSVPLLSLASAAVLSSVQLVRGKAFTSTFLRNVANSALPAIALCAYGYNQREKRYILPALARDGIKPIRPPVWDNNGKTTVDDFMAAGTIAGLLAASLKRPFASVTGWRRYMSLPLVGCHSGMWLGLAYFAHELENANSKFSQLADERKMQEKALELQRQRDALSMQSVQAAGPPPLSTNSLGSGSQPYFQGIVRNESVEPFIDYVWKGSEDELRAHIQMLEETKKSLIVEAEYMWLEIAKKEHAYYGEKDPELKDTRARQLRVLEVIHRLHYGEIGKIDWLIANLKKNIRQLQASETGTMWLPQQEHLSNPDQYNPELSAHVLRKLWESGKEMVYESDQMIKSTPSLNKHLLPELDEHNKALKKDLAVIDDTLRDFEKRVQDANNRS